MIKTVTVVMAAGGYPEKSETGKFISGIGKAEETGASCVLYLEGGGRVR